MINWILDTARDTFEWAWVEAEYAWSSGDVATADRACDYARLGIALIECAKAGNEHAARVLIAERDRIELIAERDRIARGDE